MEDVSHAKVVETGLMSRNHLRQKKGLAMLTWLNSIKVRLAEHELAQENPIR